MRSRGHDPSIGGHVRDRVGARDASTTRRHPAWDLITSDGAAASTARPVGSGAGKVGNGSVTTLSDKDGTFTLKGFAEPIAQD